MEARNRSLKDWYGKLQRGEIKLPRFQRYEAWDRQRIASLIETVIHDLPLGITLTLEVGEKEQFVSRYLETTTPLDKQRVLEHLLDGQQRLTALWRAFHNNYDWETYFIYLKEYDSYDGDQDQTDMSVFCRTRYLHKNGEKYPLWCNDPAECLRRGYIPTDLLKPEDIQSEIDDWLDKATRRMEPEEGKEELRAFYDFQKKLSDRIKDMRAVIANYNLPYLSLPAQTDKSVALDVFIKMNTNSKPLSQYDVIVAEVEEVMGSSLHDLQDALDAKHPEIGRYSELPALILTTSALLQGALPNQRGAWDMDKRVMVQKWDIMETGLVRMAEFLRTEGIYDSQRLPTNAVLAVIAALYEKIPTAGDKRGQDELLLKKYLWYAFFTDRYENAAATHAFYDFIALKRLITGEKKADDTRYTEADVPIFSEHKLAEKEELLTADWPKRASIRGRAVLAVMCRLGALDFATGEQLNVHNIEQRQYHHVYPDALLKEAEIESFLALNCALISGNTNQTIGRKDPVAYLRDRYNWTSEEIVSERLQSHLIPIPELANGGYEELSDAAKKDKLSKDYHRFLERRAELVMHAVQLLVDGRQLSVNALFSNAGLPTTTPKDEDALIDTTVG
ncbi:MAG: GmrSD restriction endonuclease domain-containing protein [Armatimonadota bacterium]